MEKVMVAGLQYRLAKWNRKPKDAPRRGDGGWDEKEDAAEPGLVATRDDTQVVFCVRLRVVRRRVARGRDGARLM